MKARHGCLRAGVCIALLFAFFLNPVVLPAKSIDDVKKEHAELRFGMFMHFNINTYYAGWANDRVDPRLFNPKNLDCTQWAKAAKAAGMKYGLLTAKHHDGFSIWPSKQVPPNGKTPYTIAQSSVPTRDVVKEYTDAFRAEGLLPGLYVSMWDVANGVVGDWAKERTFVLGQITELLSNYGKIPVFAFDGYAWKMGHQKIPYQEIVALIRKLQPECLILDHNGIHKDAWHDDVAYYEGGSPPAGNTVLSCSGTVIDGSDWFWTSSMTDPNKLMSTTSIISLLKSCEATYCNLLLNCPPNRNGVLDDAVVTRLTDVGKNWQPNLSRPPLPTQTLNIESPLTPVAVTATSGAAMNAVDHINDRDVINPCETLWQPSGGLPQSVTMDFGKVYDSINMLRYLPKRNKTGTDLAGDITGYKIYKSNDGTNFTEVTNGTWPLNDRVKVAQFDPVSARFIKFEATAASGGSAIAADLDIGTHQSSIPVKVSSQPAYREISSASTIVSLKSVDRKSIRLSFVLKNPTRVSVKIFSPTGKQIYCGAVTNKTAGYHEMVCDMGSDAAQAVYFVSATFGEKKEVRKIMLGR